MRAKFPDAPPFALKFLDRSALFTPAMFVPAPPLAHSSGATPGAHPLTCGAMTLGLMQPIVVCMLKPATAGKGQRHARPACTSTGLSQP